MMRGRWWLLLGCLLMSVPLAAQAPALQAIVSLNNQLFALTDEAFIALNDTCPVPNDHTIRSAVAVSPTGEAIVYLTRTDDAQTFLNSCVLAGENPAPVALDGATLPAFAPDEANQLALTHLTTDGTGVLAIYDAVTLTLQQTITPLELSEGDTVQPAHWLPDGRLITRSSVVDGADGTTIETAYIYDGETLVATPQVARLSADTVLELFIGDEAIFALMESGTVYALDPATGTVTPDAGDALITATAPLQLQLTADGSSRDGTERTWSVVDASGATTLDFTGATTQLALTAAEDTVWYVSDEGLSRWQAGAATTLTGGDTSDEEAGVASVSVPATVRWSLAETP